MAPVPQLWQNQLKISGTGINAYNRERTSREDRLIGRNIPKEHRLPPVQTWRAQNMFALLSNLQQPSNIQVNSS